MTHPTTRSETTPDGTVNVYWGNRKLGYAVPIRNDGFHFGGYALFFANQYADSATNEVQAVSMIEALAIQEWHDQNETDTEQDVVLAAWEAFVRTCKREGRIPFMLENYERLCKEGYTGILHNDELYSNPICRKAYEAAERCQWLFKSLYDNGNDFPIGKYSYPIGEYPHDKAQQTQ